ncbi:hypothetical protein A2Z67_01580 [Candidatus Woesebacteria bacterium RBG_13_36_22]|uniref:Uncharacterized protein n=1 Tax=Candidatus Woesebacteria bacterium RBG_13_36_22 TaxID=1802478 RepID=A0A1F7X3E0_9BACT|nr:MAG: hypothetical protein A2Z67_01580 [Candidatus Woesebacteria bacterium RBG_13_36_22]
MNVVLIQKVQKWVEEIYSNADHLVRTGYWVKKLNPKANDALIIAAITHDIERAFKEDRNPPVEEFGANWDNPIYDKWHSERSVEFVSEFLKKEGTDQGLIDEVSRLIGHHEHGGWKEADILRDADSLSFLEVNVGMFISWIPDKVSKEEVKEKFDYMFNRIGGKRARELAEPLYKKALEKLGKVAD